jgi:hypothetical protein
MLDLLQPLPRTLKCDRQPPASPSEVPAVHVGGTKKLRPKVESKAFKLSSVDRNLESSLKGQAPLEKLPAEVPAECFPGFISVL